MASVSRGRLFMYTVYDKSHFLLSLKADFAVQKRMVDTIHPIMLPSKPNPHGAVQFFRFDPSHPRPSPSPVIKDRARCTPGTGCRHTRLGIFASLSRQYRRRGSHSDAPVPTHLTSLLRGKVTRRPTAPPYPLFVRRGFCSGANAFYGYLGFGLHSVSRTPMRRTTVPGSPRNTQL